MRVGIETAALSAQLHQDLGELQQVQCRVAAQQALRAGMAAIGDQVEDHALLGDPPRLADARMVEADEIGLFAAVAEHQVLAGLKHPAEPVRERAEIRLGTRHQPPPKTSTSLKRQAGEAWPTWMIWLGSPLPQLGVPATCTELPTPVRERQKDDEMPR